MEEEDKGEREQCCGAHEMRGDHMSVCCILLLCSSLVDHQAG
jgi:hypothetical protein